MLSAAFAFVLFVGKGLAPEVVSGGWFIPPVVNIVVLLAVVFLVPGSSPSTARLLVALSYAFFGMDMLLYVLVMSMLHERVFLHPLPSPALAPSLWIGLGPIGVGSPALVKTVPASLGVLEYALGTGGEAVKPLSPGKDVGADAAQFLKLLADPTRRQILWAGGSPARG